MPALRGVRRRRAQHAGENEESLERWLLTYADMITLLLALFVVLYAMSSINTSKFEALTHSLRDAFSGRIIDGGDGITETGMSATRESPQSVVPNIAPSTPVIGDRRDRDSAAALEARIEQDEFERIRRQIMQYARAHALEREVEAVVARRGLVVRLLTDRVLFDSGYADLKPQGIELLNHVANAIRPDTEHPILVEGHTDDVPINTARFASNWELSTARATEVVRHFISRGLPSARLGAAGYADEHPVATNATASGRARNRRVEVVLQRLHSLPSDRTVAPEYQEGLTIP